MDLEICFWYMFPEIRPVRFKIMNKFAPWDHDLLIFNKALKCYVCSETWALILFKKSVIVLECAEL